MQTSGDQRRENAKVHLVRMGGAKRYPSMPQPRGDGYRFAPPILRTSLVMTFQFRQNGLLRNLEPFKPYRHGRSTALVIPIRTPATISGFRGRACSAKGG